MTNLRNAPLRRQFELLYFSCVYGCEQVGIPSDMTVKDNDELLEGLNANFHSLRQSGID
jgi:hypothetical protein